MKAVILAGGQGTRMGNLTKEIPKPMLKVGDKPILQHQIELFVRYGITDIIILVNYLKNSIIEYFGNGSAYKANIKYFEEKSPLGTVGGIKEVEDQLTEDFIVFYGDVMIDMHLGRFIDFHKKQHSKTTLVLHPNDHPYDSDLVEMDNNYRITAFHAKPHQSGQYYRNLVNAGAYILSPVIFPFLEKGKKADFGRHIFPAICNKIPMYGYNTAEYLKDMGTPERWKEVEGAFVSGKIARSNYENKQKAIFLDRDGVLNEERGLFNDPEILEIFDFVPDAVKKINQSDYKAIVVTNQASVAKNIASIEEINTIHNKLETMLGNKGAKLDEIYFCPHHPDKGFPEERPEYKIECDCRKPKPGMILRGSDFFNLDLSQSYIIGDSERDILAGKSAGCHTVGVMTGFGLKNTSVFPDFNFYNMAEAIDFIIDEPYFAQYNKISGVVNSKGKSPILIGIGGNAKTGKSNLAAYLKQKFEKENKKVLIVKLDDYILPEDARTPDMNVFQRFNLLKIESDFEQLLKGQSVSFTAYKNHPDRKSQIVNYKFNDFQIIIVEGVVALSSEKLRNSYDIKLFTQTNEEDRLKRIRQYYYWKGKHDNEIDRIIASREKDEYEVIEKESKFTDIVITS